MALTNIAPLTLPYYQFNKLDGTAFFNCKIYVGEPDTDPAISGNQIVVSAVQEDQSLTPLTQPMRTNTAGYVVDGTGAIAFAVVDQNYSIAVYDQNDVLVYEESEVTTNLSGDLINLTPEMFGALGCPADDTAAFDQAISAQQASGLTIELQRSCYKADLNVLSGQDIKMFSKGYSKIETINGTQWIGAGEVQLKGIELDFVSIADGLNGLEITDAASIRINDCKINNAPRTNLVFFDCSNFIVSDSEFNGAGREQYVNPSSNVNIGCGMIMQDCKQDTSNPLIVKGCSSANPWQIGFFVYNDGVGTETHGVVLKDNYVYGARDNGIRTQTQGLPFDPMRCRNQVVQGNYVYNSSIDNYRCNGGNNSFTGNHSVEATGYGMKSDGGKNNNMSGNHDIGSSVSVGLRIGADTVNYALDNNVSINCTGAGAAIYGVLTEDSINVENISMSDNKVFDLSGEGTSLTIAPVSGITTRAKNVQVTGNFSSQTNKQGADFSQVDRMMFSNNAIFESNQTTNIYSVEFSDCNRCNISGNLITPKDVDGSTNWGINFLGGLENFGTGNFLLGFEVTTGWGGASGDDNFLQDSYSDFTKTPAEFTLSNITTLGPRLSTGIDVNDVASASSGQEAALLVLGWATEFIGSKEDGRQQLYTTFTSS